MKIEIKTTHKTAFRRTIILVIELYSAEIIAQFPKHTHFNNATGNSFVPYPFAKLNGKNIFQTKP